MMFVDIKNGEKKFYNIPNTNEKYNSIKYGSIRFFDSYTF